MDPLVRAVVIGGITAAAIDLTAFVNARSKDPTAKFDFVLCGTRTFLGVLLGFAGGQIPVTGQGA